MNQNQNFKPLSTEFLWSISGLTPGISWNNAEDIEIEPPTEFFAYWKMISPLPITRKWVCIWKQACPIANPHYLSFILDKPSTLALLDQKQNAVTQIYSCIGRVTGNHTLEIDVICQGSIFFFFFSKTSFGGLKHSPYKEIFFFPVEHLMGDGVAQSV